MRTLGADHRYAQISSAELGARLMRQSGGRPLDILALSGGGAGGAFGAGALVGLTDSGRRPQFTVVTGVSTGALIAPYAFLGAAWDREAHRRLCHRGGRACVEVPGVGRPVRLEPVPGAPLEQLVDSHLTDEMLRAIAREARKGRLLLVATTDVDSGAPVVWDLGSIAMNGGAEARARFREVLVASASVPGIFPPVVIDRETHVDGGVTVPFFAHPRPTAPTSI